VTTALELTAALATAADARGGRFVSAVAAAVREGARLEPEVVLREHAGADEPAERHQHKVPRDGCDDARGEGHEHAVQLAVLLQRRDRAVHVVDVEARQGRHHL